MKQNQLLPFISGLCLFILIISSSCRGEQVSKIENDVVKGPEQDLSTSAVDPAEISPGVDSTTNREPVDSENSDRGRSGDMVQVQVVFDNYSVRNDLATDWGFSALISLRDQNVLFDTGAAGSTLFANMAAMGIEPGMIQNIVLSHQHNDHTGGLQATLAAGSKPNVYLLPSFSDFFKTKFDEQSEVIEVSSGLIIIEQIYSTGEIPGSVPEQALIIDTSRGLVIITGCAHPGIVEMVRQAKQILNKEIYLVVGGFHLGSASSHQVKTIIEDLQSLGVENVGPCHCTGQRSINQFREAFGDHFIEIGVGKVIDIEL